MAAVTPQGGVTAVFIDTTGQEVAVKFVENLLLEPLVTQDGRDGGELPEDKVKSAPLQRLTYGLTVNDAAATGSCAPALPENSNSPDKHPTSHLFFISNFVSRRRYKFPSLCPNCSSVQKSPRGSRELESTNRKYPISRCWARAPSSRSLPAEGECAGQHSTWQHSWRADRKRQEVHRRVCCR